MEKILTYQKFPYSNFSVDDIVKHDNGQICRIQSRQHLGEKDIDYIVLPQYPGIRFTAKHEELSKEFETKWCCQTSSENETNGDFDLEHPRQVKIWTKYDEKPNGRRTLHWYNSYGENGTIDDDSNSSGHCYEEEFFNSYEDSLVAYRKWIQNHIFKLEHEISYWNEEIKRKETK